MIYKVHGDYFTYDDGKKGIYIPAIKRYVLEGETVQFHESFQSKQNYITVTFDSPTEAADAVASLVGLIKTYPVMNIGGEAHNCNCKNERKEESKESNSSARQQQQPKNFMDPMMSQMISKILLAQCLENLKMKSEKSEAVGTDPFDISEADILASASEKIMDK